ncbi:unnamed protein product [Boreogadus saida]
MLRDEGRPSYGKAPGGRRYGSSLRTERYSGTLKLCSMAAELLIQQPGFISMYRTQVDHKFIKGPKFDLGVQSCLFSQ